MTGYIVAPEADDDIYRIWRFLYTKANLDTANRVEAELYGAFSDLARTPGQGHQRSDLTSHPVLFFTVYSYMMSTVSSHLWRLCTFFMESET